MAELPSDSPATSASAPRHGWPRDSVWAAALLAVLLLWDASGFDRHAVHWFGSAAGFAWRDHWLLERVLHDGARAAGWAVVALLAVNLRWPLLPGLSLRERAWWLLATLAAAATVSLLKQASLTSCPWDLAEFGGRAAYVSHWQFRADGGDGRCFPSGHASTAFALLSGWFVLRRHRPRLARRWLLAVVLAGLLLGAVQLARGAHYPSHTLWTGWWCYTLQALLAPALGRPAADRRRREGSALLDLPPACACGKPHATP